MCGVCGLPTSHAGAVQAVSLVSLFVLVLSTYVWAWWMVTKLNARAYVARVGKSAGRSAAPSTISRQWRRWSNIMYVSLHLPLLFIVYDFYQLDIPAQVTNNVYQVRCLESQALVVMYGQSHPIPYTFTDLEYRIPAYQQNYDELLRFYCQYEEDIAILQAEFLVVEQAGDSTYQNLETFFAFRHAATVTDTTNFSLETIDQFLNHTYLWLLLTIFLIMLLGYYLLVQLVRIVYQVLVYGTYTFYPYRSVARKNTSTRNDN